jgi:hypothetical protein
VTLPSFSIDGAKGQWEPVMWRYPPEQLGKILQIARRLYLQYLERSCIPEPLGVVIINGGESARLIFETPVLLPEEQFVPLELLRYKPQLKNRNRR